MRIVDIMSLMSHLHQRRTARPPHAVYRIPRARGWPIATGVTRGRLPPASTPTASTSPVPTGGIDRCRSGPQTAGTAQQRRLRLGARPPRARAAARPPRPTRRRRHPLRRLTIPASPHPPQRKPHTSFPATTPRSAAACSTPRPWTPPQVEPHPIHPCPPRGSGETAMT